MLTKSIGKSNHHAVYLKFIQWYICQWLPNKTGKTNKFFWKKIHWIELTFITLRKQNFCVLYFNFLYYIFKCWLFYVSFILLGSSVIRKQTAFFSANDGVNPSHHTKCTVSPWDYQLAAHKAHYDCNFLHKKKRTVSSIVQKYQEVWESK